MAINATIIEHLGITEDDLAKRLTKDVREVFSMMVGMEDLLHIPIQIDPVTHFEDCITAMVGMAGSYNGLVSLHAPQTLALTFTESMLGMEVTELDDDVRDALGEITNMIAGSFKQHLSKGGADISLSTPSVVTGSEYIVTAGSKNTLTLRFATDEEWFMVSVTLDLDE